MTNEKKQIAINIKPWRTVTVVLFIFIVAIVLVWRVIDLQVSHSANLQSKADARQQRVVKINANRGSIYDRNGHLMAISSPVDSIWVNPKLILQENSDVLALADFLNISYEALSKKIVANANKTFLYVKRHIPPEQASELIAKKLQGVFKERQYKRYYPMGEVTSHLLGFTNIDDQGQEGLELAYNHWLNGEQGRKKVLRNRLGQTIEELVYIKPVKPGKDIYLSIDKRIQYIAYRELKKAVVQHGAKSGSVVVIDVQTGEVMAVANQPAFNPNNRSALKADAIRNRALVDVFEPGSTMKTFAIAAALESGAFNVRSRINTSPGKIKVGNYMIKDPKNYGELDLSSILMKSSNVGMSKVVLGMPSDSLWALFKDIGFGHATDIGYPGEQSGVLTHYERWSDAGKAALSYGYGVATTTLQLAHAYASLANNGIKLPLSLQKQEVVPTGKRILSTAVSIQVKQMLNNVASAKGTAVKAQVPGYKVGGKTGTVKVSEGGGYADDKYLSLFAGVVPLTNPKYAVVIVINEPAKGEYYGGQVAAPIFANIMADTLRFMNIAPDDLSVVADQKKIKKQSVSSNNQLGVGNG